MTILICWDAQLRTSAEDDKMLVVNFGVVHIEYEIYSVIQETGFKTF